jgi:hypothetical protein
MGAATILGAFLMLPGISAQGRVFVFDEEVIEGRIEKPEAFYILSPSSLEYDAIEVEASFLEELYRTVTEVPF